MAEKKEDLSLAGYILGIIGIILAFVQPIVGLVLGIVGTIITKKKGDYTVRSKKLNMYAIILSVIMLIIYILITIFAWNIFGLNQGAFPVQ